MAENNSVAVERTVMMCVDSSPQAEWAFNCLMSSSESSEVPDWVFKLSETDSDKAVQDEESSSQEHSQVFFTPEKEDVQSRKRESPSLDFGESPIKYVRSTFEIESRKKRLQDRQARKPKPQPSKPKLPRFPVNKPHTTSSKSL